MVVPCGPGPTLWPGPAVGHVEPGPAGPVAHVPEVTSCPGSSPSVGFREATGHLPSRQEGTAQGG